MTMQSYVKWQERYASFGLNRKLAGLMEPGVYWGFELGVAPGGGLRIQIGPNTDDYSVSVAVVEREGYSITLRDDTDRILEVPGPGTWYPVLEAYYTPGQDTVQQYRVVAAPEDHHVVLGTVVVPSGANEIAEDMISDAGRMVGNTAMLLMMFTSELLQNETQLLEMKRRLANLENWAATQGYIASALYI